MRYYIVDNNGNVWGDFGDLESAKIALENYPQEEITANELEIIEGI